MAMTRHGACLPSSITAMLARLLSIGCLLALACAAPARAASSEAAAFATREPYSCPVVDTDRPPSAQEAAALFACDAEGVAGSIMRLVTGVEIQSMAVRHRLDLDDAFEDLDPTQPVVDIRGRYVEYMCSRPSQIDDTIKVGANCTAGARPTAKGECWRTNAKQWRCKMLDLAHSGDVYRTNLPPPRQ